MSSDGQCTKIFLAIQEIAKTKGSPTIAQNTNSISSNVSENLPFKIFPKKIQYQNVPVENTPAYDFSKWFLKLFI
jgi:hypothetical protein